MGVGSVGEHLSREKKALRIVGLKSTSALK